MTDAIPLPGDANASPPSVTPMVVTSRPHKYQPGDPPMHIDRLRLYSEEPSPTNTRLARELLARCGDLVYDGVLYRCDGERIRAIPREFLGMTRQQLAIGIDKLEIDKSA